MANTYITNTAKFKPFSFQEMLQPYQMYTEAYNEADAQLNALYEDAATKAFNFGPNDTKEKAQYDEMMSKLKTASDALSAGDKNAFKTIKDINKEYRQTMIPIQQQIAKRAELAAEQRKLLASNPNLRFTKNYETAELGDITANSSFGIIDLDSIFKETATEFAAKTSKIYKDNFDPVPIGNTGYYNVKTGYGYTPEEFVDAFYGNNGSPKTNSDIYKFYKNKIDTIKARTDISPEIKAEMADAIYRGMEASAGEFTIKQIAGKDFNTNTKLSDVELQKYLNSVPKNTDFVFDGDIYHKDNAGRTYKIGTQKDNLNSSTSSGSTSVRGGRPTDTIKIKFKVKRKNHEVKSTDIIDLTGSVGKIFSYDNLPSYMQDEVNNYIGTDDTRNYNYYVDGNELIISPKKVEIKSTDEEVEDVQSVRF